VARGIEIELEFDLDLMIERTRDFLEALIKLSKWLKRKHAVRLAIYEADNPDTEVTGMGTPLSNTDTRLLIIVPVDDKDKREKIQAGTMEARSLDESVATIALDPADEFQARVTPVDDAQSSEAKFEFRADADLGEGIVNVVGEYSCPIVDQMATMLKVEEGGDTPKEPTPTPTKK